MAASIHQASQTPEFPYWPFSWLSVYSQMARDFGNYTQAMTRCTDAMEAARVEGDFGVRLFADLMRGYYDLALAPWTAVASVMAERAGDARAPAVEIRPTRSRAIH
jgi:hypothetical protein